MDKRVRKGFGGTVFPPSSSHFGLIAIPATEFFFLSFFLSILLFMDKVYRQTKLPIGLFPLRASHFFNPSFYRSEKPLRLSVAATSITSTAAVPSSTANISKTVSNGSSKVT
jgi:hypothetical protein